jgi:hypothetical protein
VEALVRMMHTVFESGAIVWVHHSLDGREREEGEWARQSSD